MSKQLINEARRMQELAGIVVEEPLNEWEVRNTRPTIEKKDNELYLDYTGSVGHSSFGNLKSLKFKVTITKGDPKHYMIFWKEHNPSSERWDWEAGAMKTSLRNSIIMYAKKYLPINR